MSADHRDDLERKEEKQRKGRKKSICTCEKCEIKIGQSFASTFYSSQKVISNDSKQSTPRRLYKDNCLLVNVSAYVYITMRVRDVCVCVSVCVCVCE